MSFKKVICFCLTFLVFFGGCGLMEGVVQKDPKAFVWFSGNTENAIAYIDDLSPIMLSEQSDDQVHYEVSPGRHRIIVKKSGDEIVNRTVLLGDGITKEIRIP